MEDQASGVARVLRAGGVALVPAEGVYGFVADARRPDAVARIRTLKGRDAAKPMLGLIRLWRDAEAWAESIPAWAARLQEDALPVTLLLRATNRAPEALVGPEGLIGLRVPADPFGRALVDALGAPVVSTSANLSGEPAATRVEDVPLAVRQRLDATVDGGPLAGAPSSIVRWEGREADGARAEIVREGAVDRATLERLMGR